jgi:hypothetical protein
MGVERQVEVVCHNTIIARQLHALPQSVGARALYVVTVRDGKVVGHEAVRDDMTMLGQLGAFPPTPAMAARLAAWKLTGRDRRAAAAVSALAAQSADGVQAAKTA